MTANKYRYLRSEEKPKDIVTPFYFYEAGTGRKVCIGVPRYSILDTGALTSKFSDFSVSKTGYLLKKEDD